MNSRKIGVADNLSFSYCQVQLLLFRCVRFVFITARRFFCILLILLEKSGVIVIRIFFGKTRYGKSRRNKLFDQKHLFLIYIFFQAHTEMFFEIVRKPRFAYVTLFGYNFCI